MVEQDLNYHIDQIFDSISKTVHFVYKSQAPLFNSVFIAIIAWLSFHIGKHTITNPLQSRLHHIKTVLKNRKHYNHDIPNRIAFLQRLKAYLLITSNIALIIIICFKILKYKVFKIIPISWLFFAASTMLTCISLLWLYAFLLSVKLKKGKFHDLRINQQLYSLVQSLGTRAEGLLKIFLSPQKFQRKKHSPKVCQRKKCQQLRTFLKQKYETVQYLTNTVLNFEWCAKCKKTLPFEQFLSFQASQFIVLEQNKGDQSQVILKNNYLIAQMQRMTKWLKDVSACNCSKLYWKQSLQQIKLYKQAQKQIDQKVANLQHQSTYRK